MRSPGDVVAARYTIEERLAVGGMGAVYRARHLLSRRAVALKILHAHLALDRVASERFRREARAAADVGHPGIVEVLDAGEDAQTGELFLAMELLEGESLRDRLSRPETTRGEALALIDALLDPLAAAHEHGFVHRDLKPENAFVERTGRVKLLDFGIAKDLGGAGATLTGVALGTPHYMPPEQIMSSKGATPASDVWAVGAMIYEIVAGVPPFTGPTPHAVVVRACASPHVALDALEVEAGPALSSVVERALKKDPRERFETARALRDALRAAIATDPDGSHVPVTLRPHAPSDVASDTVRSDRPPVSTGGTSWQRVEGDGCTLSLPPGWAARATSVPNAVLLVVDVATEHDDVPTQIRFKRDPWPGDTRAYAELGIEGILRVGTLNRTTDTTLADRPAVEVDATIERAEPPYRTLDRCMTTNGFGWVAQASTRLDRFADAAPVMRAILGTFRVRA